MSNKIYIKRSVKEKLPEKEGYYIVYEINKYRGINKFYHERKFSDGEWVFYMLEKEREIEAWLEEVPLEEYLKEIGLGVYVKQEMPVRKKSRCCGRCDGVNDICVTDTKCDPHGVYGCEVCFGPI